MRGCNVNVTFLKTKNVTRFGSASPYYSIKFIIKIYNVKLLRFGETHTPAILHRDRCITLATLHTADWGCAEKTVTPQKRYKVPANPYRTMVFAVTFLFSKTLQRLENVTRRILALYSVRCMATPPFFKGEYSYPINSIL